MNTIKELSVENIRGRMIRNAARIWGMEDEDVESTFDPLVTMLIEACAYELGKINNEIHDSQTRILEQLAQMLSPDIYTGPQPAYAVAHARASEAIGRLNKEMQFYAQQKQLSSNQKEITKDVYFSPLKPITIFDSVIRYMAVGNAIYEFKTPFLKQAIEGNPNGSLDPFHVWIALDVNQNLKSLNNFLFYFDWRNDPEREDYLALLPLAKWFVGEREINVKSGINQDSHLNRSGKSVSEQNDVSLRMQKFIEGVLSRRFCTLHMEEDANFKNDIERYPLFFENIFSGKVLEKIDGKYLWIKIVFPGAIKLSALNDLQVTLNSFPVINRRLNKITYQLRSNLNIVPLKSDETFLDLINVQNSEGVYFQSNPLASGFENEAGFFTMKYGGIERFDNRSATEFLQKLLELLRDESAAFSSMGNEFLNTYISQINQSIAMIENRLNAKGEFNKPSHFLIVNPVKLNENIFVKFWSTTGLEGNNIKAGTKLNLSSGAEINSGSLMLLTTSVGGKRSLNENEKISAYRRSVLTHDRVVTQEDIITYCYHERGELIRSIEVKKGWELSVLPGQGYVRIIDVKIIPVASHKISDTELDEIALELEVKLEEASSKLIPIRVSILKAA